MTAACRPLAGPWSRVLLAAVAVIVIILVAVVSPRVRDYEQYLSGFWVGDPAFLEEAGLGDLYLYLAPSDRTGGGRYRQGYLVMTGADGRMISNQSVAFEYWGACGRWCSALKSHFGAGGPQYRVRGATISYDSAAVMPSTLCFDLNTTDGTLSLYDDRKIYAFFYKDPEASVSANAQYRGDGVLPGDPGY